MPSITAGPETKIFSNSDFVNLPIEALMVGVCGSMAAALDLDIRSQLLAISKGAQDINKLNLLLKSVTGEGISDKQKSEAQELGIILTGKRDNPSIQKDIAAIQQVLDSMNAISQDQSTRLQSLKEKYSHLYKLMSAFSKTVFDTSSGIVSRTG